MKKSTLFSIIMALGMGITTVSLHALEPSLVDSHSQQGINITPESDGWTEINTCGLQLGTHTSKDAKYRLTSSLVCNNTTSLRAIFTLLGEGTLLDLNGHSIDCGGNATSLKYYAVGVNMLGKGGMLIGSYHDQNVKAKILNCTIPSNLMVPTNTLIASVAIGKVDADPEATGHNSVIRITSEGSLNGFMVLSNHNYLFENSAERSTHAGYILGSNKFTHTKFYLKDNVFKNNVAKNNNMGFIDKNLGREQFDLNFDVAPAVNYNLFEKNKSEANQKKSFCSVDTCGGTGFAIQGPGGKYVENYAADNEGSGFNYFFGHSSSSDPLTLAIFDLNESSNNTFYGFAATTYDGTHYRHPNGAIFQFNKAADYMFDRNKKCAADNSELNALNRWISNEGIADFECTQEEF